MANEIQPVNMRSGAGVAAEAMKRSGGDEGGEFVLYPVGLDQTVARHKADHPISLEARHFSAIITDRCNKAMFDRRNSKCDMDIGACKKRRNALQIRRPGYISPVGPFNMTFVLHYP